MAPFRHLLKSEFQRLLARPTVRYGFLAFLGFELLLLALLQNEEVRAEVRRSITRIGFTAAENFTGPTIVAFVMSNTIAVLGNLQIALVSGDIVAREVEQGTMRMLLCRPPGRGRVFLSKLLVILAFTFLVIGFISLTSLPLGLLSKGTGYWLIPPFKESYVAHHEFWPGLGRYLLATVALALSDWTLACLAFMFSCWKMKPVAATVAAIAVLLTDDTIRELPYFASIKPWFLMSHVVGWLRVYDDHLPWAHLARNYSQLFAWDAAFVAGGWLVFRRRDFKP